MLNLTLPQVLACSEAVAQRRRAGVLNMGIAIRYGMADGDGWKQFLKEYGN